MTRKPVAGPLCLAALVLAAATPLLRADTPRLSDIERAHARQMLRTVMDAVSMHYYDATYGGIDLSAHLSRAQAAIDAAPSVSASYAVIAEALLALGDSHTYFMPPDRPLTHDLGWSMQMVGDTCFITAVVPGSDAEARGLRAGDRVLRFESVAPTRRDLWRAHYMATVVSPRPLVHAVVQAPGGYPRSVTLRVTTERATTNLERVASSFPPSLKLRRTSSWKQSSTLVWTVPTVDLSAREIDAALRELRTADSLILDLRGNSGGDVKALERLAGAFFDRDVKIADPRGRTPMKPLMARKRRDAYRGRMIVLVDADSASAAELLARVLQLEHRATIVGDRTAGSVRQAVAIKDVAMIADADMVMADGRSLENAGVVPDVIALPSAQDLAAARDVVLERALALLAR